VSDEQRELLRLRAQVAAFEASRWWRLHPRFALQRLRARHEDVVREPPPDRREEVLPEDFAAEHAQVWRSVAPYTMTTPGKIEALAQAVEYAVARGVPGAFVECGVWRGGSMMAVALTLLRLGVTDRDLYLFDTFAGMTPPGPQDVKKGGRHASDVLGEASRDASVWGIAGLAEVRAAVLGVGYPAQRIHFVEGPVEETLPRDAPAEIALLRLDTDWYASTKHELVHLYPLLVSGGVLIIDDYAFWRGSRQAVDEYVRENEPLLLIRIDHGARVAIKP